MIRAARPGDADALARIYNYYVRESVATFEEAEVSAEEMTRRLEHVNGIGLPWLISTRDDAVLGYAYATEWKPRTAYRHTAESTVYLDREMIGTGLGRALYMTLLSALAERQIHTVLAGISLPNEASVALHERLGFEKVGQLREVGYKFGRWIDVGLWQYTP